MTKKNLATWEREGRKPDSFLREIYVDQKEVFDRYATMAGSIEAGIQQYVAHLLISYAPSQIGG